MSLNRCHSFRSAAACIGALCFAAGLTPAAEPSKVTVESAKDPSSAKVVTLGTELAHPKAPVFKRAQNYKALPHGRHNYGPALRGPGNDECGTAALLACNSSVTVDNSTATENVSDPIYSCHFFAPDTGFGTVWYRFVATATSAQLDTCAGGGGTDSLVAVYSGACESLTEIACNDDAGGTCALLSRVRVMGLTVGQQYFVQLSAYDTTELGTYTLNLVCPAPAGPPNDECAGATTIACGSATPIDNTLASTNAADPQFPCYVGGSDNGFGTMWYKFVATATSCQVDTCGGGGFDSLLAVYSGSCGGFTELACNDDSCGLLSKVRVESGLVIGQTYYIQFGVYAADELGNYTVHLACPAPAAPTNDLCANAVQIAVPSMTAGSTDNAVTDTGTPGCGSGTVTSPGVWYRLTGTGHTLTISDCGNASWDSKINAYVGTCEGGLTCVAGNDDACGSLQSEIIFCSTAGTTYYILVHGFGGATGAFTLVVSDDGAMCTLPQNDLCANAATIALPSTTNGSTIGTTQDAAPNCGNSTPVAAPGSWYRFIGNGRTVTASMCGSGYDTEINAYTGTCSSLNCIAGNDDSCGLQSSITFCTVNGTEYLLLVYGFGGQSGTFTLALSDDGTPCSPPTPPANDLCANAALLTCVNGQPTTVMVDNTLATVSADDPIYPCRFGAPGQGVATVWYKFVATSATASLETLATAFAGDSMLAAYSGTCGSFTELACNDDTAGCIPATNFGSHIDLAGLAVGTTYYVQLSSFAAFRNGVYTLTFTTSCSGEPPPCATADPTLDCFNPGVFQSGNSYVRGPADGIRDDCQCVANWNRDTSLNSGDVTAFIFTWLQELAGTVPAGSSNLNCDGGTNSGDVSFMITQWFNALAAPRPYRGCP